MNPRTIIKVLSANDAGQTGGHQAGLLISKSDDILSFFPKLNQETLNPRTALNFTDASGKTWNFVFIYYNNRFFGGTRNEYRLTHMTRYIREAGLVAGDEILLRRDVTGKYWISHRKLGIHGDSSGKSGKIIQSQSLVWREIKSITTDQLDLHLLEKTINQDTGLTFAVKVDKDSDHQHWYLIRPRDLPDDFTFCIRTILDWQNLKVTFEPGAATGKLLSKMGAADETGRIAFRTLLDDCESQGAKIEFQVNESEKSFNSDEAFSEAWMSFHLTLDKDQSDLAIRDHDPRPEILLLISRFTSAITALLPYEAVSDNNDLELKGYPEGATCNIKANRYERDRRNRAAAISIHGTSCKACGMSFGSVYGEIAEGFIEVHHITPISQLGTDYRVEPANDLIPLCANCHAVIHRQQPPLDIEELRAIIQDIGITDKDKLKS